MINYRGSGANTSRCRANRGALAGAKRQPRDVQKLMIVARGGVGRYPQRIHGLQNALGPAALLAVPKWEPWG